MSRLPPGLLYLTIYNPTLPPAQPNPDDEDAEEQAHILFYTARERAVSRDRILRQVGLVKALVNFTEMFNLDQICENVHSQSRRMVVLSPEPNFWLHACFELAKTPRPPAPKPKGKGKEKEPQAKGNDAPFDYHDSSLHDGALKAYLLRGYEEFKLTHGSFTSILSTLGQQALEAQIERFFTVWAWKWDIEEDSEFGDHLGVPLHPYHRTLLPLLDSFSSSSSSLLHPSSPPSSDTNSTPSPPASLTPLLLIPPHIVPSTSYTSHSAPYSNSLPRHLLTVISPSHHFPSIPTAGNSRRGMQALGNQLVPNSKNGAVRHLPPSLSKQTSSSSTKTASATDETSTIRTDDTIKGTSNNPPDPSPPPRPPQAVSNSTIPGTSEKAFLTMSKMNAAIDVRNWNWPGYLSFGKGFGRKVSMPALIPPVPSVPNVGALVGILSGEDKGTEGDIKAADGEFKVGVGNGKSVVEGAHENGKLVEKGRDPPNVDLGSETNVDQEVGGEIGSNGEPGGRESETEKLSKDVHPEVDTQALEDAISESNGSTLSFALGHLQSEPEASTGPPSSATPSSPLPSSSSTSPSLLHSPIDISSTDATLPSPPRPSPNPLETQTREEPSASTSTSTITIRPKPNTSEWDDHRAPTLNGTPTDSSAAPSVSISISSTVPSVFSPSVTTTIPSSSADQSMITKTMESLLSSPPSPAGPTLDTSPSSPTIIEPSSDLIPPSNASTDALSTRETSSPTHAGDPSIGTPVSSSQVSIAPPPMFECTNVYLSGEAGDGGGLDTRRRRVLYLTQHDLTLVLIWGEDDDYEEERLVPFAEKASTILGDLRKAIDREDEKSREGAEGQLTSVAKILQPKDRHVVCTPNGFTASSSGFKSTSEHLYSAQQLLDRDPDILEIFSRSQNPQHWHIARRGLGADKEGNQIPGQVYMEVERKETSLTDVDNEVAGVAKRFIN